MRPNLPPLARAAPAALVRGGNEGRGQGRADTRPAAPPRPRRQSRPFPAASSSAVRSGAAEDAHTVGYPDWNRSVRDIVGVLLRRGPQPLRPRTVRPLRRDVPHLLG